MITQVQDLANKLNTSHIAMVKYFWEKEKNDYDNETDSERRNKHVYTVLNELKGTIDTDADLKSIWDATNTNTLKGKDNK